MNKTWVSLKCHFHWLGKPNLDEELQVKGWCLKSRQTIAAVLMDTQISIILRRADVEEAQNEKMLPAELNLKLETVKTLRVWQSAGHSQSSGGLCFFQIRQVCVCLCVCFSFDNGISKTWNSKRQRAALTACVHLVPQPWQNCRSLALGIWKVLHPLWKTLSSLSF